MSIHTVVIQSLSVVRLSATPWAVAPYILGLNKSRDVASKVNRRGEVVFFRSVVFHVSSWFSSFEMS